MPGPGLQATGRSTKAERRARKYNRRKPKFQKQAVNPSTGYARKAPAPKRGVSVNPSTGAATRVTAGKRGPVVSRQQVRVAAEGRRHTRALGRRSEKIQEAKAERRASEAKASPKLKERYRKRGRVEEYERIRDRVDQGKTRSGRGMADKASESRTPDMSVNPSTGQAREVRKPKASYVRQEIKALKDESNSADRRIEAGARLDRMGLGGTAKYTSKAYKAAEYELKPDPKAKRPPAPKTWFDRNLAPYIGDVVLGDPMSRAASAKTRSAIASGAKGAASAGAKLGRGSTAPTLKRKPAGEVTLAGLRPPGMKAPRPKLRRQLKEGAADAAKWTGGVIGAPARFTTDQAAKVTSYASRGSKGRLAFEVALDPLNWVTMGAATARHGVRAGLLAARVARAGVNTKEAASISRAVALARRTGQQRHMNELETMLADMAKAKGVSSKTRLPQRGDYAKQEGRRLPQRIDKISRGAESRAPFNRAIKAAQNAPRAVRERRNWLGRRTGKFEESGQRLVLAPEEVAMVRDVLHVQQMKRTVAAPRFGIATPFGRPVDRLQLNLRVLAPFIGKLPAPGGKARVAQRTASAVAEARAAEQPRIDAAKDAVEEALQTKGNVRAAQTNLKKVIDDVEERVGEVRRGAEEGVSGIRNLGQLVNDHNEVRIAKEAARVSQNLGRTISAQTTEMWRGGAQPIGRKNRTERLAKVQAHLVAFESGGTRARRRLEREGIVLDKAEQHVFNNYRQIGEVILEHGKKTGTIEAGQLAWAGPRLWKDMLDDTAQALRKKDAPDTTVGHRSHPSAFERGSPQGMADVLRQLAPDMDDDAARALADDLFLDNSVRREGETLAYRRGIHRALLDLGIRNDNAAMRVIDDWNNRPRRTQALHFFERQDDVAPRAFRRGKVGEGDESYTFIDDAPQAQGGGINEDLDPYMGDLLRFVDRNDGSDGQSEAQYWADMAKQRMDDLEEQRGQARFGDAAEQREAALAAQDAIDDLNDIQKAIDRLSPEERASVVDQLSAKAGGWADKQVGDTWNVSEEAARQQDEFDAQAQDPNSLISRVRQSLPETIRGGLAPPPAVKWNGKEVRPGGEPQSLAYTVENFDEGALADYTPSHRTIRLNEEHYSAGPPKSVLEFREAQSVVFEELVHDLTISKGGTLRGIRSAASTDPEFIRGMAAMAGIGEDAAERVAIMQERLIRAFDSRRGVVPEPEPPKEAAGPEPPESAYDEPDYDVEGDTIDPDLLGPNPEFERPQNVELIGELSDALARDSVAMDALRALRRLDEDYAEMGTAPALLIEGTPKILRIAAAGHYDDLARVIGKEDLDWLVHDVVGVQAADLNLLDLRTVERLSVDPTSHLLMVRGDPSRLFPKDEAAQAAKVRAGEPLPHQDPADLDARILKFATHGNDPPEGILDQRVLGDTSATPVMDPRVLGASSGAATGRATGVTVDWKALDAEHGRDMAETRQGWRITGHDAQGPSAFRDAEGNLYGRETLPNVKGSFLIPNHNQSEFTDAVTGELYVRPNAGGRTDADWDQLDIGPERVWPIRVAFDREQIARWQGDYDSMISLQGSGIAAGFDKYMTSVRFTVTQVFPAYHVRNMVTDLIKSLQADSGVLFHPIMNLRLAAMAVDPYSRLGGKINVPGFGKMASEDFLYMADLAGVKSGEMLADYARLLKGEGQSKLLDMDNAPTRAIMAAGSRRENVARYMTFVQRLRANGGDVADASWYMTRHHFDYNNLSSAERKYMRNVFLFYTWFRKNIPLQLAELVRRPSFFLTVGHNAEALEEGRHPVLSHDWSKYASWAPDMSGNADENTPVGVPEFVQDRLGALKTSWNGYTAFFSFGAPWADLALIRPMDPGGTGEGLLAMTNPLLSAGYQAISGRNPFLGSDYREMERDAITESDFGLGALVGDDKEHLGLRWAKYVSEQLNFKPPRMDAEGRWKIDWRLKPLLALNPGLSRLAGYSAIKSASRPPSRAATVGTALGVNVYVAPKPGDTRSEKLRSNMAYGGARDHKLTYDTIGEAFGGDTRANKQRLIMKRFREYERWAKERGLTDEDIKLTRELAVSRSVGDVTKLEKKINETGYKPTVLEQKRLDASKARKAKRKGGGKSGLMGGGGGGKSPLMR